MKYTAAVITVSDMGSRGLRQDTSGPAVRAMLEEAGFSVAHTAILPDEMEQISAELRDCADRRRIDLIVTTGGTGLSPRDVTPEATRAVLEREIPAIPVAMWIEGLKVTPRDMLSRAVAGIRGSSLLLNLPGSEKAARENLAAVIEALEHGLHMIAAEGHECG
jgi:molybdopterin adenylyltransferase